MSSFNDLGAVSLTKQLSDSTIKEGMTVLLLDPTAGRAVATGTAYILNLDGQNWLLIKDESEQLVTAPLSFEDAGLTWSNDLRPPMRVMPLP